MAGKKKPQITGDGAVELEETKLDRASGGGVGANLDTTGRTIQQPPPETPPITGLPTIGAVQPVKFGSV